MAKKRERVAPDRKQDKRLNHSNLRNGGRERALGS